MATVPALRRGARYQIEVCAPNPLIHGSGFDAGAFDRVWRLIPIGEDWRCHVHLDLDGGLFLKGNRVPLLALLQHWMRRFHVGREFAALNRLRELGLAVPEPLACGVETRYGIPLRAFLLEREIAGAVDLERMLRDRELGGARRRRALAAAGRLVERLHRCGFYHGDLACRNLLVRPGAEGFEAFAVDLPRLIASGRRPSAWRRRRDLRRLAKSALRCNASERDLRALLGAAAGEDPSRLIDVTRRTRALRSRTLRKLRIHLWRWCGI